MKIILCFLVLAGLVALISAAPDDKADAAKAATDAAAKAKKEAEDAAKKLKDPAKEIDDAKKAEDDTEKEVKKGAKDCLKPHHGTGHKGILSTPFRAAEKAFFGAEEFVGNLFAASLGLIGM